VKVYGTIVVDESIIFKITDIHLRDEGFVLWGEADPPTAGSPVEPHEVRIHGEDGSLLASGISTVGWPSSKEEFSIELPVVLEGQTFGDTDRVVPPRSKVRRRGRR